jgi:hypothetical protein
MMPNITNLKPIMEKLKALSKHVNISANMNGELTLEVEADQSKTEIFFTELINPELGTFHIRMCLF